MSKHKSKAKLYITYIGEGDYIWSLEWDKKTQVSGQCYESQCEAESIGRGYADDYGMTVSTVEYE